MSRTGFLRNYIRIGGHWALSALLFAGDWSWVHVLYAIFFVAYLACIARDFQRWNDEDAVFEHECQRAREAAESGAL